VAHTSGIADGDFINRAAITQRHRSPAMLREYMG
jgi:hypothetical protein